MPSANPVLLIQDYVASLQSLRGENSTLQSRIQVLVQEKKGSKEQNDVMKVNIHIEYVYL